ncbi:Sensor histidine kinase RcsC [Candidatus Lokiarchaeum ossiferum]|uniref:Sensor histidine kinase RcsC n=1 Tax=Candidatus Lokiarchaeum ossiferum TaxID=2951803 RepID=A0ABY6HVK6_9ARCH|nr:Sensor histidine kinase RcsC [Candidatus Lokiarchaeum sp. B-35]
MSDSVFKKQIIKYASVISIGLILSFSSYLTIRDINDLKFHQNEKTEVMISQVSVAIHSEIEKRVDILMLLRDSWIKVDNIEDCYSPTRFESEIPRYFNFTLGFRAINWIDVNGTIRWIYPYEDNIGALNKSIIYIANGDLNIAFKDAQETGKMGTMGVFTLYQGGYGFITIIPLIVNSTLTGYLNGVFELSVLCGEILRPEYGFVGIDQYSVSISFNNQPIYQQGENFTQGDPYAVSKELNILDSFEILIALRPLAQLIAELSIWNNSSTLILGFTLAAVVAILVQSLINRNNLLHISSIEKAELMQKLHLQQKMESLGTLAGGMAHDFNNLLAGIQGNVSLIDMNLKDLKEGLVKSRQDTLLEIDEDLQEIQSLIKNSGKIINQITQFSRSPSVELKLINANIAIDDLLKGFRKMIDRRITMETQLVEEEIYLLGDHSRFNQIFLNLWINARDAIGNNSGLIQVTSRLAPKKTPSTPERITTNQLHIPSSKIYDSQFDLEIQVSDTGMGIPLEIQDKIFDPFFSTKEKTRQGAGLGLTIVYSSMESMDGNISVTSKENQGTTFTLTFPILNRQFHSQLNQSQAITLDEPLFFDFHDLTLLLIEDEEMVKNSIQKFLRKCRATMYSEGLGLKGLKLYKSFPQQFDLVILDINLPGMNGIDIYREIKKINPKQPILFITGYSEQDIPPKDHYDLGVMVKPFELVDLAKKIQRMKKH